MTNIDGLICTWDFKDRLVAVENAEMRAAYTYDYTDRRITKSVVWTNRASANRHQRTHLSRIELAYRHLRQQILRSPRTRRAHQIRLERQHPRRPRDRLPEHQPSASNASASGPAGTSSPWPWMPPMRSGRFPSPPRGRGSG